MSNGIFMLAGIVLIAEEGPSFGTPVFTREDRSTYFIQSSSDESYVEDFVELPSRENWRKSFAELRSNRSYVIGAPFLYGFRDNERRLTVDEKFVLQLKLHDEFDKYKELPFLSFSIARFIENQELAMRALNAKKIQVAIENGELTLPRFFEQPAVSLEEVLEAEIAEGQAPRKPEAFTFTAKRVERLKELWEAGLSASQIAADLGNVTRNAVIGKVHRLGLSGRAKSPTPRTIDLESIRRKILSSDEAPSNEHQKSLLQLNEETCHWPIGLAESSEFWFCGAPTLSGLPYCASHARTAYKPSSDRRNPKSKT